MMVVMMYISISVIPKIYTRCCFHHKVFYCFKAYQLLALFFDIVLAILEAGPIFSQ